MNIITLPIGYSQQNTYIVYNENTLEGIIIDPGSTGEPIQDIFDEYNIKLQKILLTHGHFDHIEAIPFFKKHYENVEIISHRDEALVTDNINVNLSQALRGIDLSFIADIFIKDNDYINLIGSKIKAIHTPGHTPGGICFYFEEEGIIFTGDTLFYESIGRTDFPLGNYTNIIESIKNKLLVLPDETKVYSGHGKVTTIGHEKINNSFLK